MAGDVMSLNRNLGVSLIFTAMLAGLPAAQSAGTVVRMDPALDALVPPGAVIEKVAGGFGFTEGPVWRDGGLLFSDIPGNAIHRLQNGQVSVLRPPITRSATSYRLRATSYRIRWRF